MQGLSTTSHWPMDVPPHGPLRRFFGQVCGQTYSIWPRTQLPQAWQPKRGDLMANSARSRAWDAAGRLSIEANNCCEDAAEFSVAIYGEEVTHCVEQPRDEGSLRGWRRRRGVKVEGAHRGV